MQSIRRAALRSALSASRTVSSTTRSSPFAAQVARKTVSPLVRPSSVISARLFSQTGRVANEEKPVEESEVKPTEEAAEAVEESEVKPAEEAVEAVEQPAEAAEAAEGVREFPPETKTPYGVFVRNIVYDATEEHLRALFEKYGKVNLVQVARDGGQMSKGFAFVYFTNELDQQEAIRNLDQSFWHGRRMFAAPQQSISSKQRATNEPSCSLYIGNLPYETTDSQLNELFSSLNGVVDVRVAVDRTTGWPRGFCHVDFRDIESSTAAMEQLKGKTLGDRELKLDWAVSRDRNLRDRGNRGNRY